MSCGQQLFALEGEALSSDASYLRGTERERPSLQWQIADLIGNWPSNAWLGTKPTADNTDYGEFFHWVTGQWKRVTTSKQRTELLTGMLPWSDQGAMAVVEPPYVHGARLVALGNTPAALPRFTRPTIPHERCGTRIETQATAVLGPGDAMIAGGQTCDVIANHGVKELVYTGLGVERLRANQPQGEFLQLEGVPKIPLSSAWIITALVAVGPSEVWLAANSVIDQENVIGYLGRWQGTTFAQQSPPIGGIVNLLWFEQPDVLWATDLQDNLWRRRGGKWVRVPWNPAGGKDTEIIQGWARGSNDVWLLKRSQSRKTISIYHVRGVPSK